MSVNPVIDDSKFQSDNKEMLAAAAQVQEQLASGVSDTASYKQRLKNISSDPSIALIQLFFILYASPGDNTRGGLVQDQIGTTGAQLKLNGALTAVGNDLNNMVNSDNNNPASLSVFANDSSQLMGELSGDKSNKYYSKDLDPNLASPSLDPTTEKSIHDNLQSIRKFFNIPDAAVPGDNPVQGTDTYYFDPSDSKYIQSFGELQDLLKKQGDGKSATEAAKAITDDFATNTQSTQTASAVLNNDMKTYSPLLQAIQQFDGSLAQMINAVKKASISHTTAGQ